MGKLGGTVLQCYFPHGSGHLAARHSPPVQARPAGTQARGPLAPRTALPVQRYAATVGNSAFPLPEHLAASTQTGGQPLAPAVLQRVESFFGTSFADVRVHVGPQAGAIGAVAFTQGSHIHFAPGQYPPSSPQSWHILGHELAHVVQQRAGRVRNPFGAGVAVVQDAALEAEAERLGSKVRAEGPVRENKAGSAERLAQPRMQASRGGSRAVQRIALRGGHVYSSFDSSQLINSSQAVLTAAATSAGWTGGHAVLFLEYLDGTDDLARTLMIDLVTPGDGSIVIRRKQLQVEYKPGWWASWVYSRSITGPLQMPPQYQAYTFQASKIQRVIAEVSRWENRARRGEIQYQLTLGYLRSLISSTEYVNCAEFVAAVFGAAGLGGMVNVDLLSRPASVTTKDTRTREQIYQDARDMV